MFKYIQGIVLSVKACHDRNIAHCDIKPSNFMLDQYGRVKVGNFGLATLLLVDDENKKIKGTRYFMAPEVITQKEYDLMKADIWAIGVTLYYLTTLTYPFYATDQDSLFSLIIKGNYRIDRVPDSMLRQVILKCLETNPNDRPTVDQLIEMPYFKRGSTPSEKVLSQAASKIIKPRVSSRKPKHYRSGVFSPSENQRVVSYLEMLKSNDNLIV
ncbi:protein kinase, putative [Trichomonas vaginalis G3]|uniref:Protein kinase, putative n=1 Tax=Trichomonas vaginalis (strain ATCC PRA-98 / G3) TaxID=412133 RepID=A2EBQ9_TRIV3|nr:protein serine/threonine kinase protein [Trichomonas vaginalis G3]EAY09871.1 protein kinase, putative [Trichomonas vaginalis G3]KAI5514673.1 protein serine/threonine kinase protein [Trichomonas vaginalis G3]|eukprot:XP_001322094.1 protein kinase [Trichomonas vaginalis G3]